MDYKKLYETNADFKNYVDKYCEKHKERKCSPVEVILEHKIVREYAEMIVERWTNEEKKTFNAK